MWRKEPDTASITPTPERGTLATSVPSAVATSVRTTAWLGQSIRVKGEISGDEDLQIDGKVEGPISLGGHRLTVGRSAEVNADVKAREVVVYGKLNGDLHARDRIEIKKDGSVVGDLNTARVMIEDGAYFKGSIEIDRSNTPVATNLNDLLVRAPKSK